MKFSGKMLRMIILKVEKKSSISSSFWKIHFLKNHRLGHFVLPPVFSALIMRDFESMKINYGLHNTILDILILKTLSKHDGVRDTYFQSLHNNFYFKIPKSFRCT